MRTSSMRLITVALATAAVAVAGCGGGSSNKPPPSPALGGTGTGAGAGTSTSGGAAITPSTSVTAPAYRTALIQRISQVNGVSAAQVPKIADCVIKKELSQGLKTIADVSAHSSEATTDGEDCARAAGVH